MATPQDPGTGAATATPEAPAPPKPSNARIGFIEEDDKPEARGPGIRDRIAAIRGAIASGQDPAAAVQAALADAAKRVAGTVADGDLGVPGLTAPAAPEQPATDAGDDDVLPEGFSFTDRGQIKGPDGKFWSEEKVIAWIQGGGKLPDDWKEPETPAAKATTPEQPAPSPEKPEEPEKPEAPHEDEVPAERIVQFRDNDGIEYEIEVDDEDLARKLRGKIKDGMRRAEFNRQMQLVQAERDELDFIYESLRTDAPGFILEQVTDPKVRRDLAVHLLSDPEIWKAIQEEYGNLPEYDDEDVALENKRLKLKIQRMERSQLASQRMAQQRARRQALMAINDACQQFADLLPDDRAELFMRHAGRDLAEYVRDHKLSYIDPADVPVILKRMGTLALFGLPDAPPAARANSNGANGTTPRRTTGSENGSPAGSAGSAGNGARVTDPKAHAERLRRAVLRRREATVVSRGGAGAAPAGIPKPPPGLGVKETIRWAREHFGVS